MGEGPLPRSRSRSCPVQPLWEGVVESVAPVRGCLRSSYPPRVPPLHPHNQQPSDISDHDLNIFQSSFSSHFIHHLMCAVCKYHLKFLFSIICLTISLSATKMSLQWNVTTHCHLTTLLFSVVLCKKCKIFICATL